MSYQSLREKTPASGQSLRFRRDEKHLIVILLATMFFGFIYTALYYFLAPVLALVIIAGIIQAQRMHIRWLKRLFYTFLFLMLLQVTASGFGFLYSSSRWLLPLLRSLPGLLALGSLFALILWAHQYAIFHRLSNRGLPQSLKSRDIIDKWGRDIYGAEGKGESFWQHVTRHLEDFEAPGASWQHQTFAESVGMTTGTGKGLTRKTLVVSSPEQVYFVIIGVWDYGKFLAIRRLLWMRKVKKVDYRLFSEDYLRDDVSHLFSSVVHGAVENGLKDFVEEEGIEEPSIREVLDRW